MQLLAASVLLACLGATFSQQLHCIPRQFSTWSFDTIGQHQTVSYHDPFSGLTRYESLSGEGVQLFDFNTGTTYFAPEENFKTCMKYQDDRAKEAFSPGAPIRQTLNMDKFGVQLTGYTVTVGGYQIRILLDDNCYGYGISIVADGKVQMAYINADQKDFKEGDAQANQDLLERFQQADCRIVF